MIDEQTDNKNCALVIPPRPFPKAQFAASLFLFIKLSTSTEPCKARASLTDASVSNVATCRCPLKQSISLLRKEATMFQTVCTTMTPDTVKLFNGNATGKLLFGVARCDNVLYGF